MNHLNNETQAPCLMPQRLSLYEDEFAQIIAQRLGIITHPKKKELGSILHSVYQTFKYEPDEYLKRLKTCPDNSPLLEHLIAQITVGETYFFRDKGQMDLLQGILLPKLIAKKRQQQNLSLRIWSAGCATGEEIYTLAMMLHELLPDIGRWQLHLLGTDINTQVLQRAKRGEYNKWSMRSISEYYKKRYMSTMGQRYILSPAIKNMVDFSYLNLNDDTYPSILNGTNSQDLILCRNVLIYFNQDSIGRFMQKISLSLAYGGYLMLGASDPIVLAQTGLVQQSGSMIFLRQEEQQKPLTIKKPKVFLKSVSIPIRKKQTIPIAPVQKQKEQSSEASPALTLRNKAKELANLGQLDQALICCQESLELDPTNKNTYFIYALTLMELNRFSEAEAALRKTLFLDRKFIEGHFQLGLLLLKNKSHKEGLKCLQNALNSASTQDPSHIVPDSQGLNYGRFVEILNAEIELHSGMRKNTDEHKK